MQVVFLFKRICLVLCFVLIVPDIAYAKEISISAQKAVVIDSYTNNILFERNAYDNAAVAI